MKIKYKNQQFQTDAVNSVVNVFKGQTYFDYDNSQMVIDTGNEDKQQATDIFGIDMSIGYTNRKVELTKQQLISNLHKVQKQNNIPYNSGSFKEAEFSKFPLTIEMETGVGKTFTYIKTIFELNKVYGWSKFIIIVPSIAIREGVKHSLEQTSDYFYATYKERITHFIYDSNNLFQIDNFARNKNISVMIINSQAFNSDFKSNKTGNIIYKERDDFGGRRPIDVIASTRPILIIDEPQSVEGKETMSAMKNFNSEIALRYSATPKKDYNIVYRLDAVDAFNKKLVKQIYVKGIKMNNEVKSNAFLYLDNINLTDIDNSYAVVSMYVKTKNGSVTTKNVRVRVRDDLYVLSNELSQYNGNYVVKKICDFGEESHIEFNNGIKIYKGEAINCSTDETVRRIQIHETIKAHIARERELFSQGIKVLSLFFIDEVAKYRQYDENGNELNGEYATIFEEEYAKVINELQFTLKDDKYREYLDTINPKNTHNGYFSIDKKSGQIVNPKLKGRGKARACNDESAYDLIMKNKEKLLDLDPEYSPVRFIFSHSALKEGWDNPNVFQICTLKHANSEVRKRQEIGRGLRLCVDQNGERQDEITLGVDNVFNINKLTVIASESYDEFCSTLQNEYKENCYERPTKLTNDMIVGRLFKANPDSNSNDKTFTDEEAENLVFSLKFYGYIDKSTREPTDLLTSEISSGKFQENMKNYIPDFKDYSVAIEKCLNEMINNTVVTKNASDDNVRCNLVDNKFNSKEFQKLWKKISKKTYYTIKINEDKFINDCVDELNDKLNIKPITYTIKEGKTKSSLKDNIEFTEEKIVRKEVDSSSSYQFTPAYDLLGEVVKRTNLTRMDACKILTKISPAKFDMFKFNPQEFIKEVSDGINIVKTREIIQDIKYNTTDSNYESTVFTNSNIYGKFGKDVIATPNKHIFDHLKYDSEIEKTFGSDLEKSENVVVYSKLPNSFVIPTPLGNYNPDWAIAFKEDDKIKHIYFVAETKGSSESSQLRESEKGKIECARKHFETLNDGIKYDVVDSLDTLMDLLY